MVTKFVWLFGTISTITGTSNNGMSCAHDIGCLSPAFFEDFSIFQSAYNHDDLGMSRKMLHNTYAVCLEPHLAFALDVCPAPTLELMLDVMLAVEAEVGTEFAKEFYLRIKRLMNERVKESWGRLKKSNVATYDFLWQIQSSEFDTLYSNRTNSRVNLGERIFPMKIYIYEYPVELEKKVLASPVGCALGQWGTEVLMHKWLMSSEMRTTDPDEADLFYVPVYATCNIVRKNLKYKDVGQEIYEAVFEFLRTQKSWREHGGIDHVFLFADGQGVNQWPWYDVVSNSILLMVDGTCPTWGTELEDKVDIKTCFSPWKDIIIPGHTDFARVLKIKELKKPLGERKLLFSWRGRSSFIHDAYNKSVTRTEIVEHFLDLPHTDVGGFSKTFFESKTNSQFCLVPSGTSPWSNHLYESIIAGCIPVILSDEYQLPFWHRLDWTKFSVKLPEGKIEPELFDHLADIPHELLIAMYTEVQQNSCWFDWWSQDSS
jgi:hypothetical protein